MYFTHKKTNIGFIQLILEEASIISDDVHVLIDLADYLNWLSKSGGLVESEFEIGKLDNKIILDLQKVNKLELELEC